MTDAPGDSKHCDDYIEDSAAPAPLRAFLRRARSPGHGMLLPEPYPRLFADLRGQRVRVTMASRLGDVGICFDLSVEFCYDERVAVSDLANFRDEP